MASSLWPPYSPLRGGLFPLKARATQGSHIYLEDGRVLIDIPLSVGVLGALVAPQLAALGAIAALVTKGTVIVEKVEKAE